MYQKEAKIIDKLGLHARPAAKLNKLCVKYKSKIKIFFGELVIEPKSILSIMAAGVTEGSVLRVVAEGEDEVEAVDFITEFLNTYSE